ncbi:hypothetical protein ACO0R3_003936 [Hanseniaspora guilliermondii]
MASKKNIKKKRCTKRIINISELTQKKLNRLNRRLHKRNILQHDLIEKKKHFNERFSQRKTQNKHFLKPIYEQKHILDELLHVQQTTNLNSDLLLKKLSFPPTCKNFVVNGECFPDCRKKHDPQLRYFYLNKFKIVLTQIQQYFYNDKNLNENKVDIVFDNEREKYGFINLFTEYYKDLKNSIYDYELKVDEFKRTYYNDDEQVANDDINKDMPLHDMLNLINNKIKLATRNNKVFRSYRNILNSFNDKSSSKLTNCTLFNNLTEKDVKTKEHAIQINRIMDMLIHKKKKSISSNTTKEKDDNSTFGLLSNKTSKQLTNKHGFFLCSDCGYSISIKDNENRLQKHFNGRTHLRYVNLWAEFARISFIFEILKADPNSYQPTERHVDSSITNNGYVRRTNRNKTNQEDKAFKKSDYIKNKRLKYYDDDYMDDDEQYLRQNEPSLTNEKIDSLDSTSKDKLNQKSETPPPRRVLMPTLEY